MLAALALGVPAALAGAAWYYGAFTDVRFSEETVGDFTLLYREHVGPYKNVNDAFRKVLEDLEAAGLGGLVQHRAGLYFDDPNITPAEKCRAYVGAVTTERLNEGERQKLADLGLSLRHVPRTRAITTHFPSRGFPSIIFAVFKVYPAFRKLNAHIGGGAPCGVLELYDTPCMATQTEILFAFPVERAPHFAHEKDQ